MVWNYIEYTIGIIAASLPTLKPLFNWALDTARAITSGGRTGGSGPKGPSSLGYHKQSDHSSTGKSVELHSLPSKGDLTRSPYNVEVKGKHTNFDDKPTGVAERDAWERGGSEESIIPLQHPDSGKNRIMRTTEVHVG